MWIIYTFRFFFFKKKERLKWPFQLYSVCSTLTLVSKTFPCCHCGFSYFFLLSFFRSKTFLHSCALYYFFVLINIQPTLILDWISCVFIDEYKLVFRSMFSWIFYLCFLGFNSVDALNSDIFRNKVISV